MSKSNGSKNKVFNKGKNKNRSGGDTSTEKHMKWHKHEQIQNMIADEYAKKAALWNAELTLANEGRRASANIWAPRYKWYWRHESPAQHNT